MVDKSQIKRMVIKVKNISKIIFFVLSVFVFFSFETNAQIFDWAKSISGNVFSYGISVDQIGNSYITGSFIKTATFDNIKLTGNSYNDFFIAKYNADGNCIWAKQGDIAINSYSIGNKISVDKNGDSYIVGQFDGTATFGNISLTAANGAECIFIVKYDSGGNCIWAKQTGNKVKGISICIDADSNCYITGNFQDTASFGNFNLISNDSGSVFIAKYNVNGNCIWAKKDNGSSHSWVQGFGITASTNGNIFITGQFIDTLSFGNIQLTASNDKDNIFVAKFDSSGNILWAKQSFGTGFYDNAYGISIDANSNSYISGQFSDTVSFDNIQLIAVGNRNAFLTKYDVNGNCLWAKEAIGNYTSSNGISIDSNGDSYITGQFFNTAKFGSIQLSAGDSANFFIAKYDNNGNIIWAKQSVIVDSNSIAKGLGIAVGNNGDCYVTGAFTGTISFGNNIISGSGFVARISNTVLGIVKGKPGIPNHYELNQNYPNPFNPSTIINYQLPKDGYVTLKVYDVLGNLVKTLVDGYKQQGKYSVNFDAGNFASGVYFYQINSGNFLATKKLILLK